MEENGILVYEEAVQKLKEEYKSELNENERRLLNTMVYRIRRYQQENASNEWITACANGILTQAGIDGGFEKLTVEFYPNGAVKEVMLYCLEWEGYYVGYNENGDETGIGPFHEDPLWLNSVEIRKLLDHFANLKESKLSCQEVIELFDRIESMKPPRLSEEEMEKLEKAGFLLYDKNGIES